MTIPHISVLHLDSEKTWRGGQQQAAYLFEGLISKGVHTSMACRKGSAMEAYCMDRGLPCYGLPFRNELDIFTGYKVASLCRKEGYNILHLHSSHALAIGLWAKLFNRAIRLIAVRRVDFHISKNIFSRFKYTTSLLNKIICVSDGIKRVLIQDDIPIEKLATIHDGIDLKRFDGVNVPEGFRETVGIPVNHTVIGTVAALAGHKDYPNLLHAAHKLLAQRSNVTFCAVGDGPDRESIHLLAKQLNLGDRFVFTGFRKDVGHLLKCFDIFVLASYLEGLGTSILDAQALGLPVVACRTGGIPEVVYHEENGYLVSPRDPDALMAALIDLIDHPDKRSRFGQKGRETAQSFSIDQAVERNIELYKSVCDPNRP
jgi:glycosyltransferase involved in cell wall biosynthesis